MPNNIVPPQRDVLRHWKLFDIPKQLIKGTIVYSFYPCGRRPTGHGVFPVVVVGIVVVVVGTFFLRLYFFWTTLWQKGGQAPFWNHSGRWTTLYVCYPLRKVGISQFTPISEIIKEESKWSKVIFWFFSAAGHWTKCVLIFFIKKTRSPNNRMPRSRPCQRCQCRRFRKLLTDTWWAKIVLFRIMSRVSLEIK